MEFGWKVTPDGRIQFQKAGDRKASFVLEIKDDQLMITNPEGKVWSGKYLGKAK